MSRKYCSFERVPPRGLISSKSSACRRLAVDISASTRVRTRSRSMARSLSAVLCAFTSAAENAWIKPKINKTKVEYFGAIILSSSAFLLPRIYNLVISVDARYHCHRPSIENDKSKASTSVSMISVSMIPEKRLASTAEPNHPQRHVRRVLRVDVEHTSLCRLRERGFAASDQGAGPRTGGRCARETHSVVAEAPPVRASGGPRHPVGNPFRNVPDHVPGLEARDAAQLGAGVLDRSAGADVAQVCAGSPSGRCLPFGVGRQALA